MDVHALFDKLVTDLTDRGVTESSDDSGARLLVRDGVPFARLGHDERMAFRAARGHGVRAQARRLPSAEDAGDWVVVPADDVAQWENMAREALAST